MEYDRKNGILSVTDCDFQNYDSTDAFVTMMDAALKNQRLRFSVIEVTQEQYDWFHKKFGPRPDTPASYKDKPLVVRPDTP